MTCFVMLYILVEKFPFVRLFFFFFGRDGKVGAILSCFIAFTWMGIADGWMNTKFVLLREFKASGLVGDRIFLS